MCLDVAVLETMGKFLQTVLGQMMGCSLADACSSGMVIGPVEQNPGTGLCHHPFHHDILKWVEG